MSVYKFQVGILFYIDYFQAFISMAIYIIRDCFIFNGSYFVARHASPGFNFPDLSVTFAEHSQLGNEVGRVVALPAVVEDDGELNAVEDDDEEVLDEEDEVADEEALEYDHCRQTNDDKRNVVAEQRCDNADDVASA